MVKTSMELIKTVAIIVLAVSSFFGFKSCKEFSQKYQQAESVLTSKEKTFTNIIGQHASQVKVMQLKFAALEKAHEKAIQDRTEYEKSLAKAYQEIELYKHRERNLISYQSNQLTASDTIFVELPNDCLGTINPIRTAHLELDFIKTGIPYRYTASINTMVSLFPKKKTNGRNHFPNWGFIWGWDKEAITTVDDENATITNSISIEFRR